MAKTVVAVYQNHQDAESAIQHLLREGFNRNDVSVVARDTRKDSRSGYTTHDSPVEGAAAGAGFGAVLGGIGGLLIGLGALAIPGIGPIVAAGPIAAALAGAGAGAVAGGITGALVDWGVPSEDANVYGESVRRGGILVAVRTSDEHAQHAANILEDHNPVDVNRHAEMWRQEGWSRFDERAGELREGEMTIPIIEEQIKVGKRQTERGGVRVERTVTETPVEEQVRLRDETVHVERRDVDRPASESDFDTFEEGTIEIIEEHEEPVVEKHARVVGEVAVKKEARERVETVAGQTRRTDVRVEDLGDTGEIRDLDDRGEMAYLGYESEWQNHFRNTYSHTGRNFDEYRGAYVYGCRLYDSDVGDWNTAEAEARRYWQNNYPGQRWEDYRDAVRQGFMVCERM